MLVWKDSTTYERELQYPESNSISIESRIGEAYQGDHCAVYDTGQIRVFGRLVNEPGHEGGKEENEADLDEPEYVHGRIASTRERGLRPHHVVRGEVGAVLDASHDYRGRRSHQGDDDVIHPLLLAAYAVEVETGEEWDYNEDGEFDEEEKEFSENVDSIFWKYYLGIIDDISGCTLYNYKNLKTTYYNSSVIGDIVDKYLKGDISKDKFIRQLSAATEIYLTE